MSKARSKHDSHHFFAWSEILPVIDHIYLIICVTRFFAGWLKWFQWRATHKKQINKTRWNVNKNINKIDVSAWPRLFMYKTKKNRSFFFSLKRKNYLSRVKCLKATEGEQRKSDHVIFVFSSRLIHNNYNRNITCVTQQEWNYNFTSVDSWLAPMLLTTDNLRKKRINQFIHTVHLFLNGCGGFFSYSRILCAQFFRFVNEILGVRARPNIGTGNCSLFFFEKNVFFFRSMM